MRPRAFMCVYALQHIKSAYPLLQDLWAKLLTPLNAPCKYIYLNAHMHMGTLANMQVRSET